MLSVGGIAYAVRRRDPELVPPASETPRETKCLSDLDDKLRVHVPMVHFYRGRRRQDGSGGDDPVAVIRRALSEALVQYYPLAGRLREMEEGGRLVVDCTGEGVLLVEADADVKLAELEAAREGLRPPFCCWDQLLLDVEGSRGMRNSPLLLIQVTRLLCGGFVFAFRFNHTICDGCGISQFMNAVGSLARGLPLSVTPVWSRELIKATPSPSPTVSSLQPPAAAAEDMVTRSFTFSASEIAAIKKSCGGGVTPTTFEALAAFLWRAHTLALQVPLLQDAPLGIAVKSSGMITSLPAGYYGNTTCISVTLVSAAALRYGSLADTLPLVRLAKAAVTPESFHSMVDAIVGGRYVVPPNLFYISDARRLGLAAPRVDFGWGEPVFAGPVTTVFGTTFLCHVKDPRGEDGAALLIVLPRLAMDRFTAEVAKLSNGAHFSRL